MPDHASVYESLIADLIVKSDTLRSEGDQEGAGVLLDQAYETAQRCAAEVLPAAATIKLADKLFLARDLQRAQQCCKLLLSELTRLTTNQRARCERTMAFVCLASGLGDQALHHFEAAETFCERADDRVTLLATLPGKGQCELSLKRPKDAVNSLSKALSIAEELGAWPVALQALLLLQEAHYQMEQFAEVLRVTKKRLEIALDHGNREDLSTAYGDLAQAQALMKDYGAALDTYQTTLSLLNSDEALSASPLQPYTEDRIRELRKWLGEDLLRFLPDRLAAATRIPACRNLSPDPWDWPVTEKLRDAVLGACSVLLTLFGASDEASAIIRDAQEPDAQLVCSAVGSIARRYADPEISDPSTVHEAARYLMQVDRTRRAAGIVKRAEDSRAGAGPSGGGVSKHVLYLRSFVASDHLPAARLEPWGTITLEEYLACQLDGSPLIALGQPELAKFGPGRANTTDDNWKEVLRAVCKEAQMILVIPALTEGTSWEIEWVVTNKFLHKAVFLMPPSDGREKVWWTENWNSLRSWGSRMNLRLPEYSEAGSLLRLDALGLVNVTDFELINDSDLHMSLLSRVCYQLIPSTDFLYSMWQAHDATRAKERQTLCYAEELHDRLKAMGLGDIAKEDVSVLKQLDHAPRSDFSNWSVDASRTPKSPGIFLVFEAPDKAIWMEETDNLFTSLASVADGEATNVGRIVWNDFVLPHLSEDVGKQLHKEEIDVETLVRFRIRHHFSYKFIAVEDEKKRAYLADLILGGALSFGPPQYQKRDQPSTDGKA